MRLQVFEGSQRLIRFDDAGLYGQNESLLAAVGWVLQAARDVDTVARRGTLLGHVAGAVAQSGADLLGHAFENAIVDLLGTGRDVLPQLAEAVSVAAGYYDFQADFASPRVIALVLNRSGTSLLRARYDDVARLVDDAAVVLTPRAGRPVTLWGPGHDRLRDLLESTTSGRGPSSLTPTVGRLHRADLLLGDGDGRSWLGVDLKSGGGVCSRDNAGVHFGISEDPTRYLMDSEFEVEWGRVPGRGEVPVFIELRLGSKGTPLDKLRDAIRLMQPLAGLRPGTRLGSARLAEAEREVLSHLQPVIEEPIDEAIEILRPWTAHAVDEIYVPAVGLEPELPTSVTARL